MCVVDVGAKLKGRRNAKRRVNARRDAQKNTEVGFSLRYSAVKRPGTPLRTMQSLTSSVKSMASQKFFPFIGFKCLFDSMISHGQQMGHVSL